MNLENEKIIVPIERTNKQVLIFHMPKSFLQVKAITEEKIIQIVEAETQPDIIPFYEMKIQNTSEVYRIAKSYIKDLENEKKSFGFVSLNATENDLYIAAIAGCLSYSRNNSSVLMIVKDLASNDWTKYSKNFKAGTLGQWKTIEWGNLCIIDYRELLTQKSITGFDFKLIYSEFDAIFWSLPKLETEKELKETSIDVLRSLDSISIVLKPGNISASEIKSVEQHYKSLGIPLKGILQEGSKK